MLLLAVLGLNACYSHRLVTGSIAPDTRIVLSLNDRGRVDYGQQIGAGTAEVEGRVESASDSLLVLRISAVRNGSGRLEPWNGERFVFAMPNVTNVRERRFSQSKTVLAGVAVAVGIAAAFLAAKLLGGSSGGDPGDPVPGPGDQ